CRVACSVRTGPARSDLHRHQRWASCCVRTRIVSGATRYKLVQPLRRLSDRAVGPRPRSPSPVILGALNRPVPPEPIDLRHQGAARVIGSYVLDTEDGPALFDCGPTTTVERLKEGLGERGLRLTDVRHMLLSHIH